MEVKTIQGKPPIQQKPVIQPYWKTLVKKFRGLEYKIYFEPDKATNQPIIHLVVFEENWLIEMPSPKSPSYQAMVKEFCAEYAKAHTGHTVHPPSESARVPAQA